MNFTSEDKCCQNCGYFSIEGDKYKCGFYLDEALITMPYIQYCGDAYVSKLAMERNNKIDEILK